jgi:hypothetical protein
MWSLFSLARRYTRGIKMKVFGKRMVDVEVDRTCDVCNQSVMVECNGQKILEMGELRASFSYGSKQDGASYQFDLCESCFMDVVVNLKERLNTNCPPSAGGGT